MEERIIRAIKRVEFFKQVRGYWDNTADAEELETILTVLRAELDREKKPLTVTVEDVVSEAYDRGYNIGYSDGYQDGTKGEEPA